MHTTTLLSVGIGLGAISTSDSWLVSYQTRSVYNKRV